jgi:site-specific recombinase XerD
MTDILPTEFCEFAITLKGRVNPSTAHYYTADLRQHFDWLAGQSVAFDNATVQDLQRYTSYLAKERSSLSGHACKYASSTIARKVSALREFYSYLYRKGAIKCDLAAVIKRPKTQTKSTTTTPSDAIIHYLGSLDTSTARAIRDQAIIALAALDGLKVGQIAALDVADVDMQAGVVHVARRRGQRGMVFLSSTSIGALTRWLAVRRLVHVGGDDSIFPSMHWTSGRSQPGTRISKRGLNRVINLYRGRTLPMKPT